MGGGPSANYVTPIIQLSCLSGIGCDLTVKDFTMTTLRRLTCNPKGFWKAWQDEVLRLTSDWRVSSKELALEAQVKTAAGIQNAKILIETGAKTPLAFRSNFIDPRYVRMAAFPVKFYMADGKPMESGSKWVFMEVILPVK